MCNTHQSINKDKLNKSYIFLSLNLANRNYTHELATQSIVVAVEMLIRTYIKKKRKNIYAVIFLPLVSETLFLHYIQLE